MENYINNYKNFEKTFVYDFNLKNGGIGDFIKFFMLMLTHCMENNIKIYHKINNIEIEKYIKFKYDFMNITIDDIEKLNNVTIQSPCNYYNNNDHYKYNVNLNEVFYFDNSIKSNVEKILPSLPTNYISIHLRLGDNFLECDRKYVISGNDVRKYSDEKIYKFIENNSDNNIILFCDNNAKKLQIKEKYKQIIIANSEIGHTGHTNTTNTQALDAITEFYILSNSQLIYAASYSGFSKVASQFKNIEYIT